MYMYIYLFIIIQVTGDLAFDIQPFDMEVALEAFADIYSVSVSRTVLSSSIGSYSWTISFISFDLFPSDIYADGHLLQGIDVGVTVNNDFCPSASRYLSYICIHICIYI
jgi:hypothetical protein